MLEVVTADKVKKSAPKVCSELQIGTQIGLDVMKEVAIG